MMSINEIIEEALQLKPQDRYRIIERLSESLNQPDPVIEKAWIEESEGRMRAIKRGELKTMSYEEVFGK